MTIRNMSEPLIPKIGKDIDKIENISTIVSAMVEQRTSLGLSQRELTVRPTKPTI